jgi:hypothetical protein
VARGDLACRWSAVCDAAPGWAQADPDDYVLIDDAPVPGYVAPPATIGPAARVSFRPLPPESNGLIIANGEGSAARRSATRAGSAGWLGRVTRPDG